MTKKNLDQRIKTNVHNLDILLGGGMLPGSLIVFAGSPGAGKTILSQQIFFSNASPKNRVLIFQTLSEPTAKTLKYLKKFTFFDAKKLEDESIQFIDLGCLARSKGLEEAISVLMAHVKRVKPAFVIIDSFKVFEDLANSRENLRKFTYEIAVNLMAWECTALLLGEFAEKEIASNPLFSIVDGIITLNCCDEAGEQQRILQVIKMRGTDHSRDKHHFSISNNGLSVYAPQLTIRRDVYDDLYGKNQEALRAKLNISQLDKLLGAGIPYGSSLLVSGAAGTGKTLLSLEFIYRGAKDFGEKGIFFSFEETEERLLAAAKTRGWDIENEIKRGMIKIIFVQQPDILVEKHLQMIEEQIVQFKAKRIAIDSISIFMYKIESLKTARERVFQLATLVQKAQAVGFFVSDVPYGSQKISKFGVEETLVDGIILLTTSETGFKRERFIEIYKLRNTSHHTGRHKMKIGTQGITIYPRDEDDKK